MPRKAKSGGKKIMSSTLFDLYIMLEKSSQPRRRQEKPREMLTPEASEKNQAAAIIHDKSSSDFGFSH